MICCYRIAHHQIPWVSEETIQCAQWISNNLPRGSIIHSSGQRLNCLSFSGIQQFIGPKNDLFEAGVKIDQHLDIILRITSKNSTNLDWLNYQIEYILFDSTIDIPYEIQFEVIQTFNHLHLLKIKK